MTEYIDRKNVEKKVLGLTIVDPAVAAYADAVLFILRHEPEADVAPVVRGEWRDSRDGATIFCSNCAEKWNVFDNDTYLFLYCPHCGAKMGGGDG